MNAIGMQMRDSINSGLARWRLKLYMLASTRFSLSVENEQADAGRNGQICETKFSGANGGREKFIFFCSVDHEQDWQPYLVDPSSVVSDNHCAIS